MKKDDPQVIEAMELLSCAGEITGKSMFGGYGFYKEEKIFACIAYDKLFLKVDEQTKQKFIDAGSEPFHYDGQGKKITMPYMTPPNEALISPEAMEPWVKLALEVAAKAPSKKKKKS